MVTEIVVVVFCRVLISVAVLILVALAIIGKVNKEPPN
jgi:hypothetical protein